MTRILRLPLFGLFAVFSTSHTKQLIFGASAHFFNQTFFSDGVSHFVAISCLNVTIQFGYFVEKK